MARVPKYRRHTLRNFAFVQVGKKRVRLPGDYGSSESRAAYAQFIAKIAQGQPLPAGADPTVAQVAEKYLDWAALRYSVGKEYRQIRYAADFLWTVAGEMPARQFGPKALERVRLAMVKAGWSRKHVNHQVSRVRSLFRWGVRQELVPSSIIESLKTVPGLRRGELGVKEKKPVAPVDFALVDRTIPWLPPVVRDMVRLQRHSGMRSANLCALKPCEVDCSGDVWFYVPSRHKTDYLERPLLIALGPRCQEVLTPYLNRPPDAYCFSPRESEELRSMERRASRKTKVQPSQASRKPKAHPKRPRRDCYDPGSYYHGIVYGLAKANRAEKKSAEKEGRKPNLLERWHPHQLRHSVATLVRKEYGVEGSQVFLGHSRADVTQIYAERDLELAKKVAMDVG